MKTVPLTTELKKDNLRNMDIVISEGASETETFAARELQQHLHKSTSIKIPVVSSVSKRRNKIIIGDLACEFLPDYRKNMAKIKHGGRIFW
jgi:hypothetical protein